MENKLYYQIQSYINDLIGTIIALWNCYNCQVNPKWEFVVIVFIGCTMVFGRNLGKYIKIPGIGGGNEEEVKTETVDKP